MTLFWLTTSQQVRQWLSQLGAVELTQARLKEFARHHGPYGGD